ncbi:MAG: NAD-dependent epimerase/dehydratase family protein [Flavisolibacter sp.]
MDASKEFDITALKDKRILITGGNGFIGSGLSKALIEAGADVYGTSRIERTSNKRNFTWLTGNFEDFDEAQEIYEKVKPQIIYHLAGVVTGSTDVKHVQGTFHSLVTSTVNLLTLADKYKCERLILLGSCREPDHESQPPNSPYSAAKWAAGAYGKMFWLCYQTPVVIVRPFVGYGPGQSPGNLIPHVILSLLQDHSPKLTNGKWASDWIYIDDIIDGMIAATLAENIEGSSIDLATGTLTSVKDMVIKIQKNVNSKGVPLFGALPDRNSEYTRLADTEFAFSKLKWKAKTTLDIGLIKTIQAYKNNLELYKFNRLSGNFVI